MNLDASTKYIVIGNIMLIVCCVFYLLWWILAFNPAHAVKGTKSGWLLVVACIFGIIGISQVIYSCSLKNAQDVLLPRSSIWIGGIVVYVVLLVVSSVLLKRQVTTELFLIVGWLVLMFIELNNLYGLGQFTRSAAVIFMVVMVIAAAVSIFCYLIYYNLDGVKGYVDGMIPLLMGTVMMVVLDVSVVVSHGQG